MSKKQVEYGDKNNNFLMRLQFILNSQDYFKQYKKHIESLLYRATTQEDMDRYSIKLVDLEKRESLIYDDIAFITDKEKSTITRWLSHKEYSVPNIVDAAKIAKAFGITTDYLLGVSSTPNQGTESEYKVFKEYGFTPESFSALTRFHSFARSTTNESYKIDYEKAIEGINFLLSQVNEDEDDFSRSKYLDIVSRIGYFLSQKKFDNYYYFDNDDIDLLYESLDIDEKETPDSELRSVGTLKECITAFLENSPQFDIDASLLKSLDTIKDKLKEYKKAIDPNTFSKETKPTLFYKRKSKLNTSEEDSSKN